MYDKMEKSKGFKFKKTNSPIINPPKHIRFGSKDFILIHERVRFENT